MSAPRTNIEKQKRRHLTPLVIIGLAMAFGLIMFTLYLFNAFDGMRGGEETGEEMEVAAPPGSEDVGAVDVRPEDGSAVPEAETSGATTEGD